MPGKRVEPNYGLEVRYAQRAFLRALNRLTPGMGVASSELRLLRTLGESEGHTQSELAALAAMDRPYVSSLVKKMIRNGVLETCVNAQDRRRIDLVLSERGRTLHGDIAREIKKVNKAAVAGISPEDLQVFVSVMQRIRVNLE